MSEASEKRQSIGSVQRALAYGDVSLTATLQILIAIAAALAAWHLASATLTLTWFVLIVALNVSLLYLARGSGAGGATGQSNSARSKHGFELTNALAGVCWAVGYLIVAKDAASEFQALGIIALCALCTVSLVASHGLKQQFFGFVGPALLIPALYCLAGNSNVERWIGITALGYLVALIFAEDRYSRATLDLISRQLETAAHVASLTASNSQLVTENEQLTELSSTDGLTQIANRRHFDQVLHREWARAQRAGNELAYVMVDIDFFKPFNDHYGHLRGDDCLKQVAQSLQGVLRRPGDFLGRYGGEEFAVISPDTPPEGGLVLGEKIRQAIEALKIPHQGSPAASCVTVSVGVSGIVPSASVNVEDLIHSADSALYEAKKQGRNQVVLGAFKSHEC